MEPRIFSTRPTCSVPFHFLAGQIQKFVEINGRGLTLSLSPPARAIIPRKKGERDFRPLEYQTADKTMVTRRRGRVDGLCVRVRGIGPVPCPTDRPLQAF